MPLRLVVPDLHVDREGLESAATADLPRLPTLEALLRFGSTEPVRADWREMLLDLAGRGDLVGVPPAQRVAAARGVAEPDSAWFATPVHLVAGLDHLRLHPAGVLRLDDAARAALVVGFARCFGGEGLSLHDLGTGFLLSGLRGVVASTRDPAGLLGVNLRDAPAVGPGAGRLRRLSSELEMWLHQQSADGALSARGLAPNGLWLWGGGPPPVPGILLEASPGRALGRSLFADVPCAAAAWSLGGGAAQPLPQAVSAVLEIAGCGAVEACACVEVTQRHPGDVPLQRFEAQWLEPAVAALRAGSLDVLRLHLAGRQWRLQRPFGWQRWRRARPWWDVLAT